MLDLGIGLWPEAAGLLDLIKRLLPPAPAAPVGLAGRLVNKDEEPPTDPMDALLGGGIVRDLPAPGRAIGLLAECCGGNGKGLGVLDVGDARRLALLLSSAPALFCDNTWACCASASSDRSSDSTSSLNRACLASVETMSLALVVSVKC